MFPWRVSNHFQLPLYKCLYLASPLQKKHVTATTTAAAVISSSSKEDIVAY